MGRRWDDDVVDEPGWAIDAEHARQREPPHVGVDGRHAVAARRERDRDVGRHRRFSDTALARRDREHTRSCVDERVRARRGRGGGALRRGIDDRQRIRRRLALERSRGGDELVLGHRPELDVRSGDALDRRGRGPDAVDEFGVDVGPVEGVRQRDGGNRTVDGDARNDAEGADRQSQLGVLDRGDGVTDGGVEAHRGLTSAAGEEFALWT